MPEKYHFNLPMLFSEVVLESEEHPALLYADKQLNYSELANLAVRLAALLLVKGCRRGDVIAIGNNKKPFSFALMLASLRVGVAYVNIDVESPLVRNSHIVKKSGARFLFYDSTDCAEVMEQLAHSCDIELIFLNADALPSVTPKDRARQESLMREIDGASIAYIMFTSGSTGIPKGVAVTHQNVLHFIFWGQQYFNISSKDNFANLSPMYFDNSVFDFYVGLFSGASLSPVGRELLSAPYDLVSHIGKMQCNIWFSVPSLLIYLMTMKAMTTASLPKLNTIVFGGEGYQKSELKKLYAMFSQQADLVNVYGPTECTCICTAHKISDDDFEEMDGLPALGKLNPNFDYQILDENGKQASVGELCLIGPNVAAGYFNDSERSGEAFFTLTEPNRFMKRMYRTGDRVSEDQGVLHFIGRKDNQIKHMGYRIELEEIENALVQIPDVNQSGVIYQRINAAYGKILAFVASSADIDERALLAELATMLPEYMLPHQVVIRSELPKNANGKLDRQALKALISGN